ncbi:MAG: 3-ketoacyl-CoA thiolase (EC @ Acetyl-CoA acetyltransferase (EC, partial [uncultured Aureispira sp.]
MKIFHLVLLLLSTGILHAQNTANLAQASSFAAQHKTAFEENKGQVWNTEGKTATNVKYHFQEKGIDIFMLPTGLAYQFTKIHYPAGYEANSKGILSQEEEAAQEALRAQIRTETYRMDMELVDANPNATIIADGESKDYVQYYNRNALDVHSFKKLTYQGVYPGIDWVIYTTDKGLKYDFIVQPGADPSQIQVQFKHHEDLKINADGSFTLSNSMGSITEQAPISFQGKQAVSTAFKLEGDLLSFDLSNYDKTKVLTIDPSLVWATYYGGLDADAITTCLVDGAGNLYLAGQTASTSNIALGGHQNTSGGATDAFLVKFNAAGVRQFATYYGGTSNENTIRAAIDLMGNFYLSGSTTSTTNIASNGHLNTYAGSGDAFLVKFNSTGIRQWATYYGGSYNELGMGCAVDNAGNVYLAGRTASHSGIFMNGHQSNVTPLGYYSAFLVKFNTAGVRQWGTYYGLDDWTEAANCAVDGAGNVYLAGRSSYAGYDFEALLVKFNAAGVRQWVKHYPGDYFPTAATDCAIDNTGNVYLVGYFETFNGDNNAFLLKYNSTGTRQWAVSYGGSNFDEGYGCALDQAGNVYLAGSASSSSGIASNGYQNTTGGSYDAFLAKFNAAGVREWATYYGGTAIDRGNACATDGMGNIYLAGSTSSTSNIASNGHQNTLTGGAEGFVVKFNDPIGCLTNTGTDTLVACNAYTWIDGVTYTASNNTATDTLVNMAGCDSVV